MLLFLKKKSEETAIKPAEPAPVENRPLHEYIPYHSHYNPHTLLTKNGELMQIIRISCNNQGLTYESGKEDGQTVRDYLRAAITECITTDRYALWVHTIRKRKNVHYTGRFNDPFAAHVHEEWQKKHSWKYQYYNEIYISILHEGLPSDMFDKKTFAKALLPKRNRQYHNQYLEQASADLDAVAASILQRIRKHYRAERLSIVERSTSAGPAIFYSELLEFLGTLLNLRTEAFPVCDIDVSKELHTHNVIFGFNALETKAPSGHRRFAAMLSLKQYREVTPESADRLLQFPAEFIISQAFVYTPARRILKEYKAQSEILQVSGDTYSAAASGLEEMLRSDRGQPTDFGQVQTTITVLSDEYKHLDEEVHKVQEAFGEMGLLTVREDIKLEECFWTQLPGNFEFIRRRDNISTPRIAGFCRLNLFPNGIDHGNHWGEAVTLMPTQANSPYFFNFHRQDNGHTLLFDFNSFRDGTGHVLLNFLLTSAMKYDGRMFIFDRNRSAFLWFDKIKGNYHTFSVATRRKSPGALHLNPFALEDSKRNRSFLAAWCLALAEPHFSLQDEHRDILTASIDHLYGLPPEQRTLSSLVDIIAAGDYKLATAFNHYHGAGKYAGLFDAASESLDLQQALHAFSMDRVIKHTDCAVPLFAYLMHRIITSLDGRPNIIVLHEGWELLDNAFFAPRLESLLEMLKQNNAILICTTQHSEHCVQRGIFQTMLASCATQIYLPDDINLDYSAQLPTLSANDTKLLAKMERQRGDFLLKQGGENIALRVNLDDMDDTKSIFANDAKTLIAAGGRFASLPQAYSYAEDPA